MRTVLLIEDNEEIRENMAEILELSNYKVLTAPDGKQGVSLAISHIPDIIVCDIMMPVLDGYGVLHMLHKNENTRHIPFIFITAKAERSEIRKGMELGADDYLTKPFNGTELLNAIETRLKKAEQLRQQPSTGMEGFNALISASSSKDILQQFVANRSVNTYRKKQLIYAEGNHALRLFYIQKGKVRTYKTNDEGKELVMGLYNEGDFIGYVSLLEGTAYKENAETIEESEIVVIPKEEFEQLIHAHADIMRQFIRMLARNVSEREEQLLGIAYNSLRKKVAEALISIYKKYGDGKEPFVIDMSRESLATIAGTAKESLIRTLSDFREERLIDISGRQIIILNEKKLANLIN